jgi:hypothetical protein
VYDIVNDGSGLSSTVVKGVGALAQYLEMNVSARVVFAPDPNPTPGFVVQVKAIEDPNDRCDGILNDEHQHCMPGATPRFNILFTNPPSPGQVKLNPNDPKGGYNFRVELIADKQFVVDQVPVYIMPVDVMSPTAPVPKVASSGTYWQDVSSANCTGNLLPDWHDLTWDSKVPDGTSVSFSVCTSDKAIATGCAQTPLCTITGGAACTTDSMCGNGFCSTDGNCQTITGKSCATTMDCTMGSTCKSSRCTFSGQPVYVGEALATGNYTANLRMFIGLTGNTTANTGPTVRNWSLSYVCNSAL